MVLLKSHQFIHMVVNGEDSNVSSLLNMNVPIIRMIYTSVQYNDVDCLNYYILKSVTRSGPI